MGKYMIILHSLEQVQAFIHAAEKIPCHMDIGIGTIVIDAKSFIGILAMGLNRELSLTIHGELSAEMRETLTPFIAAA